MKTKLFGQRVIYLEGQSMHPADLARASADQAQCVVVLSAKQREDPVLEDYRNIMRGYSVKEYATSLGKLSMRVCLQLIKPEHKDIYNLGFNMYNDQVVCIEELKLQLLAKSCVCPGIITIMSSLITSSIPPSEETEENWVDTFLQGMQNELYRIPLRGDIFGGYNYMDICVVMYSEIKVIMIGIEATIRRDQKRVFLNPIDYVLTHEDHYAYIVNKQFPDMDLVNNIKMDKFIKNRREKQEMGRVKGVKKRELGVGVKKNFYSIFRKTRKEQENEEEAKRNNYYIEKRPVDQTKIRIDSAYERRIENHVIVCGGISVGINSFVTSLRPRILGDCRPAIIFLTTEPFKTQLWQTINTFEGIYYLKGSPLNPADLERASINKASAVVILSKMCQTEKEIGGAEAEAIFIYKTIKNMNSRARIIIELGSISTISFLLSNKNEYIKKYGYKVSEPFAAGEIYIPSLLDSLMCQAFYNPYITQIMQQMIMGSAATSQKINEVYKKHNLTESALFLFDVNKNIAEQREFSKVFEKCIYEYGMLPIGIYKFDGMSKKPYVILNPSENEKVAIADQLFVLYHRNPNEDSNLLKVGSLRDKDDFLGQRLHFDMLYGGKNLNPEHNKVDLQNSKQLYELQCEMASLDHNLKHFQNTIGEKEEQIRDSLKQHVQLLVRNKIAI